MSIRFGCLVAALLTFVVPASAQTRNADVMAPFRTVSGWAIESIGRNGSPYSCNANPPAGAGRIAQLVHYSDGDKWAILLPNLGVRVGTTVSGTLELGRATEPVSLVAAVKGLRDRIWLGGNVLGMMRAGGTGFAMVQNKRFEIPLDNIGQVMGGLQDCIATLRKSGGTQAQSNSTAGTNACTTYANEMVAAGTRGKQANCATFSKFSVNYDLHFNWCMKSNPLNVQHAAGTTRTRLNACLGGNGSTVAPPPNPPAWASGQYALNGQGWAATVVLTVSGNRISGQALQGNSGIQTIDGQIFPDGRISFRRWGGSIPQGYIQTFDGRIVNGVASGTYTGYQVQGAALPWSMKRK